MLKNLNKKNKENKITQTALYPCKNCGYTMYRIDF
jgi:rubrerythrin